MFLNSINQFRGMAILFIVFAHVYRMAGWQTDGFVNGTLFNLMMNGTVFFVFISGFLFHHVFHHRRGFAKYFGNKCKFVLLPYLLLSLPWIIWHLTSAASPQFHLEAGIDNPALAASWYVITGRTLTAYWYIPMGMMLFALCPVFKWLTNKGWVMYMAIPLLLIAVYVHRPIGNLNALQSLVYFIPIYLIGIWVSAHRDIAFPWMDKYWWLLLVIAVSLAMIQTYFFEAGPMNKAPFEPGAPDLMLLQKLALALMFMALFNKLGDRQIPLMPQLADTSFAIYFIHPWITTPWWMIFGEPDLFGMQEYGNWFTAIIMTLAITLISMLIAMGIKKLLDKRSRYLIGW
ncbi:acyltransferase family protein [Corallincola spongiicola]|uniref:Acyltransferase n=1 Tax=Corallincola spongiicola TaxID=2520508 RepID=A0ABY1WQU2_9GAMM|nr:acyltransferase [Corallincola spongiicola]TAA47079.1 acyltransferase [Corallincola spongiicola]